MEGSLIEIVKQFNASCFEGDEDVLSHHCTAEDVPSCVAFLNQATTDSGLALLPLSERIKEQRGVVDCLLTPFDANSNQKERLCYVFFENKAPHSSDSNLNWKISGLCLSTPVCEYFLSGKVEAGLSMENLPKSEEAVIFAEDVLHSLRNDLFYLDFVSSTPSQREAEAQWSFRTLSYVMNGDSDSSADDNLGAKMCLEASTQAKFISKKQPPPPAPLAQDHKLQEEMGSKLADAPVFQHHEQKLKEMNALRQALALLMDLVKQGELQVAQTGFLPALDQHYVHFCVKDVPTALPLYVYLYRDTDDGAGGPVTSSTRPLPPNLTPPPPAPSESRPGKPVRGVRRSDLAVFAYGFSPSLETLLSYPPGGSPPAAVSTAGTNPSS